MKKSILKIIVTTIAIVLVVALIAGGIWFAFFYDNKTHSLPENKDTPTLDIGGMTIADGNIESSGIKLMSAKIAPAAYSENGISPQAESAYTLTASVTPANSDNKLIDWSVAWANTNSEWATGKKVTDYVTVTATTNGALTANVECKQAFGEKVVVKAESRFNADAYATCEVDYVKRVTSSSFAVNKNSSLMFELGNVNTFELTPVYSVGTVEGTIAVDSLNIKLNSELDGYVMQGLGSLTGQVMTCAVEAVSVDTPVSPFDFMTGRGDYPYLAQAQNAYNVMLRKANTVFSQGNDCYLEIAVNFTYSYNGTEIQTGTTETKNTAYSAGSLTEYAVVTSVSLNNSNLYF